MEVLGRTERGRGSESVAGATVLYREVVSGEVPEA